MEMLGRLSHGQLKLLEDLAWTHLCHTSLWLCLNSLSWPKRLENETNGWDQGHHWCDRDQALEHCKASHPEQLWGSLKLYINGHRHTYLHTYFHVLNFHVHCAFLFSIPFVSEVLLLAVDFDLHQLFTVTSWLRLLMWNWHLLLQLCIEKNVHLVLDCFCDVCTSVAYNEYKFSPLPMYSKLHWQKQGELLLMKVYTLQFTKYCMEYHQMFSA